MGASRHDTIASGHDYGVLIAAVVLVVGGKLAFSVATVALLQAIGIPLAMREPGLLTNLAGYGWVLLCFLGMALFANRIKSMLEQIARSNPRFGTVRPLHRLDGIQQLLFACIVTLIFVDSDVAADIGRAFRFYWDDMPSFLIDTYTALYTLAVAATAYLAINRLR